MNDEGIFRIRKLLVDLVRNDRTLDLVEDHSICLEFQILLMKTILFALPATLLNDDWDCVMEWITSLLIERICQRLWIWPLDHATEHVEMSVE